MDIVYDLINFIRSLLTPKTSHRLTISNRFKELTFGDQIHGTRIQSIENELKRILETYGGYPLTLSTGKQIELSIIQQLEKMKFERILYQYSVFCGTQHSQYSTTGICISCDVNIQLRSALHIHKISYLIQ